MNKEPETYEELICYKRCVDLTTHYELSEQDFDKIYKFLLMHHNATIVGNNTSLTLRVDDVVEIQPEVINAKCKDSNIDGVKVTNNSFVIIPHYVPSSSGGYSGGSSSNNNNNNNR